MERAITLNPLQVGFLVKNAATGEPLAALTSTRDLLHWIANDCGQPIAGLVFEGQPEAHIHSVNVGTLPDDVLDRLRTGPQQMLVQPQPVYMRSHMDPKAAPVNPVADDAEAIGSVAERVVKRAGGETKKPAPVDVNDLRDDQRVADVPDDKPVEDNMPPGPPGEPENPVKQVAVACKPDGSDLKANIAEARRSSADEEKIMAFMAAVLAKKSNAPQAFSYPVIAQKVGIKADEVRMHLDNLARVGRLIADQRVKGGDIFYSLPVPEKFK